MKYIVNKDYIKEVEEKYYNAVAWLLFSAALNVAFLAAWLWEASR